MLRHRHVRRTLLALFALCLALTSCAGVRGDRVISAVATDETPVVYLPENERLDRQLQREVAVSRVDELGAFAFSATDLTSRDSQLGRDLVSQGPVVMTFVVPQCPVCVSKAPEFARSAANNPEVTYVFVHSGGTPETYGEFVEAGSLDRENVVHLDDSPGLLWARFGVVQQPTNLFIDGDGNVTQSLGGIAEEDLASILRRS